MPGRNSVKYAATNRLGVGGACEQKSSILKREMAKLKKATK
jgi:hypothetical protein